MTMPTPIQPEDLTPDQLSLVPDLPQERTATALLSLLSGVSDVMDVPATELLSLQGQVLEHGSVGIFGRLDHPGAMEFVGHIVGWWKAGKGGGFTAIEFASEDEAAQQYEAAASKLSA
jgi:hypothetical protein